MIISYLCAPPRRTARPHDFLIFTLFPCPLPSTSTSTSTCGITKPQPVVLRSFNNDTKLNLEEPEAEEGFPRGGIILSIW